MNTFEQKELERIVGEGNKIVKDLEKEFDNRQQKYVNLYMRYIGALHVLCECSVYVPEDIREMLDSALEDAEAHHSDRFKIKRILDRREIVVNGS